jgi:hypothetical protein
MPRRSPDDSSPEIAETIDRLYSLGPEVFTKERDEAAKRLREQGDQEASALVKGLKKPTVAAWAVNQLSRRRPDLVAELLEAGAELRAAQRAVLSGSRKGDLREGTERRRAAVALLLDEAADTFREAGRDPAPHEEAIRSTLEAASADEAIGELARAGRLTKEAEPPSGLGDVSPFEVLPGGRDGSRTAGGPSAKESAADRRLRERLETRVVKAEATLTTARETAAASRQEADAAAKDVDRLERELRTAQRRAERASKAATTAKDRADEAARALAQAQADLEG